MPLKLLLNPWKHQSAPSVLVVSLVWLFLIVDALVGFFVLAAVLFPGWEPAAWLSTQLGFAHALAFGRLAGLGLLSLAFIIPRLSSIPLFIAGIVLVASPHVGPFAEQPTGAGAASASVRVVTFNAQDKFGPREMHALEQEFAADVYVLPEVRPEQVAAALEEYPDFNAFESPTEHAIAPTAILVRRSLAEFAQEDAVPTTFGSVRISGPFTIEGIHTAPPMPGLMDAWRADLERVTAPREVDILAGDFNATLRHGPLARQHSLADAARSCGRIQGTWPAHIDHVPAWGKAQIDHILVAPGTEVSDCKVARIGDSDHAAFGATLRLPV